MVAVICLQTESRVSAGLGESRELLLQCMCVGWQRKSVTCRFAVNISYVMYFLLVFKKSFVSEELINQLLAFNCNNIA
jgi:hypothetical protein